MGRAPGARPGGGGGAGGRGRRRWAIPGSAAAAGRGPSMHQILMVLIWPKYRARSAPWSPKRLCGAYLPRVARKQAICRDKHPRDPVPRVPGGGCARAPRRPPRRPGARPGAPSPARLSARRSSRAGPARSRTEASRRRSAALRARTRRRTHRGCSSRQRRRRWSSPCSWRPGSEPAVGRVAENLVALVHAVAGHDRALPVLAGVDDEVLAAGEPRDALAEADLLRGPIEVGGIEEEALDPGHAGAVEQPRDA